MIDPRGMTAPKWCNESALSLSTLGPIPKITSETQWRAWAYAVLSINAIQTYAPPHPRFYDDWMKWAMRFVQAVPL